ncbi:MAG: transcription antitermination factor NusB [Burkholderiales bacterium]
MKSSRRRAREVALQALYAWQLAGGESGDVLEQTKSLEGFERSDQTLAEALVSGVVSRAAELEAMISPFIAGRSFRQLSPVERAILYIGALELSSQPETPFKVVLNEAIELGKSFGGTEGHRFVNGVLEKLAESLRPEEVARTRQTA